MGFSLSVSGCGDSVLIWISFAVVRLAGWTDGILWIDGAEMHKEQGAESVSQAMPTAPDWSMWSGEAVRMMGERNRNWVERYGLTGVPYSWCLECAELMFQREDVRVTCDICVIGTVSRLEGTFLWAWANEGIPSPSRHGLAKVREFGEVWGLGRLRESEWPGGRAEGLEMVAVAGRILDADGIFVDDTGDVTIFFALSNFRS